jgi:hypothetical protein
MTFVGSKAFGGTVLDAEGQALPNSHVLFGVFVQNDGTQLFAAVLFFQGVEALLQFDNVDWALEPVFSTGTFVASVRRVFAFDPEPAQ